MDLNRGDGHWGKKEKKKIILGWYSVQGPGRMAQTPQAGTGDSVSRFRRYHCSTVINYDSYFLVGEQFCFLRVDLNPRISKICASWMSVWNISANYVLVPLKFNLNWNIWNPFLKTSPLDFSGQRLGNTSLVVFLRFHSFSQVVKWPEFVSLYTTNRSCF